MPIWQKRDEQADARLLAFTVGRDRALDLQLAPYDVLGSIAHAQMLGETGLIPADESLALRTALRALYSEIQQGHFAIRPESEDVHSEVEARLTERLGNAGRRLHTARSRNDQVLLDLKLYVRDAIAQIVAAMERLFHTLQRRSEQHRTDLLPGFTHLQLAMPSSFGLWFGAYAEALADDLAPLHAAYAVANRSPLGSGAGYGSSLPIDRDRVAQLLGFDGLHVNVVYAQMTRGKTERLLAQALANVGATLARLAMDATLYLSQELGYLRLPAELTTGSSLMPHKQNPDGFELVRAHGNRLQALPNDIALTISNLPSGYHRDVQLVKERLLPAVDDTLAMLAMAELLVAQVVVVPGLLDDARYAPLFSVEEVNRRVQAGMPFREAYRQVGQEMAAGLVPARMLQHTHVGSLGNLGNARIAVQFAEGVAQFPFAAVDAALGALLSDEPRASASGAAGAGQGA